MTADLRDDPKYWRFHAEEVLRVAECLEHEKSKIIMRRIADDYEYIAKLIERQRRARKNKYRTMSAFGPKQTWTSALRMSAIGGKADMKNVGMVLDKFLILIGMVRFAPDQCLGPRAWLSMFVQLPAPGRRRTARFRTVTNRGRKIDVRVQQAA
jgi:hypothetical protein